MPTSNNVNGRKVALLRLHAGTLATLKKGTKGGANGSSIDTVVNTVSEQSKYKGRLEITKVHGGYILTSPSFERDLFIDSANVISAELMDETDSQAAVGDQSGS